MSRSVSRFWLTASVLFFAAPAYAEPQRIAGINKDVFRTLQYIYNMNPGNAWTPDQTKIFMNAVMKDEVYDEAERVLVAALQKEGFDLIIGAAKEPQFNPNDLPRKGSLPPESRAALATGLTSEAFAAAAKRSRDRAAGPVGNETMLDYYLRTGGEGLEKLAAYALESPQKWGEARLALAGDLRAVYERTRGDSITDLVRKNSDFKASWTTRLNQARGITDPRLRDAASWLSLEAGPTVDVLLGGAVSNQIYYDVLGPDQTDTLLASVRQRLGVPAESLGK
jgi:hypothetical protein